MGYPMSYQRMLDRNNLHGEYTDALPATYSHNFIAGDLRRVEVDQRDAAHLKAYGRIAGITSEQVKAVLDAFFDSPYDHPEFEEEMMFEWCEEDPTRWDSKIGQWYAERKKEIYGE